MNFLKKLFSGDSSREPNDASGMYLYIKLYRCNDIVRFRVDMNNDLSLTDNSDGYWVRKMVSNANYKCAKAEVTLYFDTNRRLTRNEIQGGELVSKDVYESWLAQQQA